MYKTKLADSYNQQQKKELLIARCCVAVLLAVVLLLSNTGIDLFDEGYYLLGYDKKQDIYFQFTGFHFLVRLLPFSDHLLIIRIYRVLLLAGAAYVLARSLYKNVFTEHSFSYVLAYTILGNLLTYVHGPASLSYNTLSVIFIELMLAAYIAFRTAPLVWSKSFIIPVVFFGLILSLQAFNKPTSALLLAVLFSIDQFICRKAVMRHYFLLVCGTGFVSLLFFLFLIYVYYGPNIREILHLLKQPDNPFSEGHLDSGFMFGQLVINTVIQSKKFVLFSLIYLLLFSLLRFRQLHNSVLAFFLFSAVTLFVFYQYRVVYFGQPGAEYLYSFFLFFSFIWFIQRKKLSEQEKEKARLSFFLILLVLPFAGFWGSNNPPMLGIIHYMIFPLLSLVYMNQLVNFRFLPVLAVLITGFTVYSYVWAPFYNPSVLKQQKELSVRGVTVHVSDYVFSEAEKFKAVYPFINKDAPLIPAGVPNGLLYSNRLHAYYTIHFNSSEFTAGYLRLLQKISVPENAQLLVYKTEESELVKKAVKAYIKKAKKGGMLAVNVYETSDYQLIRFTKEEYGQR